MSDSDLVEVVKRSSSFRKDWGPYLGALMYWLSLKAARPRSLWWNGLLAFVVAGLTAWLQSKGWLSLWPWGRG
jgi:hypothetical protein